MRHFNSRNTGLHFFQGFLGLMLLLLSSASTFASMILIPMDEGAQSNHLKAYGIAYWTLEREVSIEWLLNYRGGAFLVEHYPEIERECRIRDVSYELISNARADAIKREIENPEVNMSVVKLEKAPKIAVYSPEGKQPWDDAVTLALTYAEIPYDVVYDDEVLKELLPLYDWLHLHHEDFTGQYGRFYRAYKNAPWYIEQKRTMERDAIAHGFEKVSEYKGAVAERIREFVIGGGFLFAMCSATDSYDISLAAHRTDICEHMFDGDAAAPNAQEFLDFDRCLAFEDFTLSMDPNEYEFSSIDATNTRPRKPESDFFTLFDFSAKWDVVPTMLCQNHTRVVKGFMGQTTSFRKEFIQSEVLIMGETKNWNEAKYIHGELGEGTWTFYGGHDPEDYQHMVGDPPTDLNLHPNSPGYRLILNNILFPAAKKKKQKT